MGLPGWGTAVGTIAKIVDLALPDKKGLLYDKLQRLLKTYGDNLKKGNNSKADRALAQLKAELKKLKFTEGL